MNVDLRAGVTGLSLFSGIGGIDLGLARAIGGYRTVGYVERSAYCQAVLLARMEESKLERAPIHGSIEAFDPVPFRDISIVHGGFPCQDISNAGKRAGIGGKRSGLWSEFARILAVCGRYAFIENVAALRTRGLDVVLHDLAERGFDSVEYDVFTAEETGAPHRRERLFILAQRVPDAQRDALRDVAKRGEGCAQAADRRDTEPRNLGEQLAHTASGGCTGSRPQSAHAIARQRCEELGDSGRERHDSHERFGWPPGPKDDEGWRHYLAAGGSEPAIRRGADGLPDGLEFRTDRLMALGNAVCPQQAELAFRVLWERLQE